ncbi:hypothetical protein P153DRAFT_369734 [Dothidotthia symphoricarpi CBS 119687]|uniref:Uncharacterized protein n=1 Tax=Dothidotthia symphoricarpi CBS 119687 TaxID=1392245 RepID=A0A6A6A149_9PLEO|nr:uncharacterized protein P153DRAFT_369734 [Dothidotthia symphoricarpi CBS 119687]KAF2125732.1 hypothetical protein P153DRAFT_369734 [Dothidotthia symphoricarpi CBS 119687]
MARRLTTIHSKSRDCRFDPCVGHKLPFLRSACYSQVYFCFFGFSAFCHRHHYFEKQKSWCIGIRRGLKAAQRDLSYEVTVSSRPASVGIII